MIKILAWIGGVLTVVAVATGVFVTVRYRPDASGALRAVERVHAISSILLALVVVVGLAAFVWERRPDRRHGLVAFGVIAVVTVGLVAETVLGPALRWDQLALWAVTVGSDLRGVFIPSTVKFLLIDGREVGPGAYRRVVWAHVVVLPVLLGLGTGFVILWTRRNARPEARPARPPEA